jgi:transketolase
MSLSTDELKEMTITLREDIVRMIHAAGSGHPGGSLSMVEILTTLFFNEMKLDPDDPEWPDRDRFILSKGHGVPALYAVLARRGYFPVEDLMTLRKLGSPLQGHPDRSRLPAVEASTGSLGQGLSIAAGTALAARIEDRDYHTYCLISDGENEEGQVWEAAMFAGNHDLGNLTAILDYNKYQLDGAIDDIQPLEPLVEKWEDFGWSVTRIDGHDLDEVSEALQWSRDEDGASMIVADTVKGQGVSFMEGNNEFHGRAPTDDELEQALDELEEAGESL